VEARLGAYLEAVLQSLGYKPRLQVVKDQGTFYSDLNDPRQKIQLAVEVGWSADYASPLDFFNLLTCASSRGTNNVLNYAHFCDRRIDAEIQRASSLQTSDPQASAVLWRKVDRDVVHEAPWVPYLSPQNLDFVSRRVRNYIYNPQ